MGDLGAYFQRKKEEEKHKPWWVRLAHWVKVHWKNGKLTFEIWRFGGPK